MPPWGPDLENKIIIIISSSRAETVYPSGSPEFTLIFIGFLCIVLCTALFVLLAIALYILLRFMASDYLIGVLIPTLHEKMVFSCVSKL